MNIVLLIGLPGSGKSTWLKSIDKLCVFDDISQTDPTLTRLKNFISSKNNKTTYISDVNFCDKKTLIRAIKKINTLHSDISISFLLFTQSPEQCFLNVGLRNDGRKVEATIVRFSKTVFETFELIKSSSYPYKEINFNSLKVKP